MSQVHSSNSTTPEDRQQGLEQSDTLSPSYGERAELHREGEPDTPKPIAKVILYQAFLPFQGRFPRVSDQCRILMEQGFDVRVLACDRNAKHEIDGQEKGIPVHRIHVKTKDWRGPIWQVWPLLVFWIRSLFWLRKQKFDVAIVHNLDVVPLGFLIRLFFRRPVIFDAHEPNYYAMWSKKRGFFLGWIQWVERALSRRMSGITVTNQYQVEKYQGMGVKNVEIIGNYPSPEHRVQEFPQEKFERPTVVFGRLGTVYRDTGFEQVVEALTPLLQERDDIKLFIAGRVVEVYEDDFRKLIEPISDHVILTGAFNASEMPALYRQVDVSLLIYPKSNWFRDITPTKFYDSLANALPVIMTDIGRLGTVIRESHCGVVVEEQDPQSIRDAVLALVDTETRRTMASNAFDVANTTYAWDRLSLTYKNFVTQTLHQTKKRLPET